MNNVRDLIELHEGRRGVPYDCSAGKLTVGVGHNIEDNGLAGKYAADLLRNGKLSDDLIDSLLDNDIRIATEELYAKWPWMKELDKVRKAVFVDMCFNMGISILSEFKNTLLKAHVGHFESCSLEMLDSKWANQVGIRAITLSKMIETGEWQ